MVFGPVCFSKGLPLRKVFWSNSGLFNRHGDRDRRLDAASHQALHDGSDVYVAAALEPHLCAK